MREEEKKVQDNENEVEVEVVDSEPSDAPESVETKEDELENYTNKNVYGSEGNHYRKDKEPNNYNRPGAQSSGGPRF